eukprot:gene10250-8168_t
MCKFIKQEAEEKAGELRVQAEEEFNLEKLQLLEQEKAKIRKEYERREAQVDVKKKIEYSKQLNEMRLKVLAAREQAIQEIVAESQQKLREVCKTPAEYKRLLTDLLVQSMRKLGEKTATVKCRQSMRKLGEKTATARCRQSMRKLGEKTATARCRQSMRKLREKTAIVRCRQVDLMLAKEVLEPARKAYTAKFNEEAAVLSLDKENFFNGGLVLSSSDGRILCANTLDARIKIAYTANLPDIRGRLFGVLAKGTH